MSVRIPAARPRYSRSKPMRLPKTMANVILMTVSSM